MPSPADTPDWPDRLNESDPRVELEKKARDISQTCKRARALLCQIEAGDIPTPALVAIISELHSLDQVAVGWRKTPQWSFISLEVSNRSDLLPAAQGITPTIQLHADVWMAYEWNYHRTSRILFLQQLLRCSQAALGTAGLDEAAVRTLDDTAADCISTVRRLADEFLSTVPQSFGDVDHMGRLHDMDDGPPRCRAIGAYLMLWPARTVKAETSATTREQKERAQRVFERIREYTGMKQLLGDKSTV